MLWPEDAAGLYDFTETAVTLAPNVAKLLCPGDPQRIYLAVCGTATSPAGVTTNPSATSVQGFGIAVNFPNLILTFNQVGSLVQSAWYGISTAGVTLTVFQVFLRRHPGPSKGGQ